jgi:hypothetical protein
VLRDAVSDDHAALRSIFRRASLSNEGDRPVLLASPGHLVWREPTGIQPFRVRVAVGRDRRALTSGCDGRQPRSYIAVSSAW